MDLSKSKLNEELGRIPIFREFMILFLIGFISGLVGYIGEESIFMSTISIYISIGLMGGYAKRTVYLVRGLDPEVIEVFKTLKDYKYVMKFFFMILIFIVILVPVMAILGLIGFTSGAAGIILVSVLGYMFVLYLGIILEYTNYYLVDMGASFSDSFREARLNLKGKYWLIIKTRIRYKILPLIIALLGVIIFAGVSATGSIALGITLLMVFVVISLFLGVRNDVKLKLVEAYIYNSFE